MTGRTQGDKKWLDLMNSVMLSVDNLVDIVNEVAQRPQGERYPSPELLVVYYQNRVDLGLMRRGSITEIAMTTYHRLTALNRLIASGQFPEWGAKTVDNELFWVSKAALEAAAVEPLIFLEYGDIGFDKTSFYRRMFERTPEEGEA